MAALLLMYCCGLRISEVLSLKLSDIPHNDEGYITILGKGNKTRQIPTLSVVLNSIKSYVKTCEYDLTNDYLFRGAMVQFSILMCCAKG